MELSTLVTMTQTLTLKRYEHFFVRKRTIKMLRLFRKQINNDLLSSKLYDDKSFYDKFRQDLINARAEVLIESPFMTVKRTASLVPIIKKLTKRGVVVRINTREPKHHTADLRREAWLAVGMLQKAGARVYLCRDLRHRKFAVIDKTVLWEGSLNILSQSRSCELMRRTYSQALSLQMLKFTRAQNTFH